MSSGLTYFLVSNLPIFFKSESTYNIALLIVILVSGLFIFFFTLLGTLVASNRNQSILFNEVKKAKERADRHQKSILETVKIVLDEIALGIFICDEHMKLKWLNKTAYEISGITDQKKIPENFQLGIDLLCKNTKNEPINLYAAHKHFHQQEGVIQQVNAKQYPVLINKNSFTIEDKQYHIFSIWNLSDRRKLQNELAHQKKMATIGNYASILTQKINTPSQFVVPNLDFMLIAIQDIFKIIDKSSSVISRTPKNKHESDSAILKQLKTSLDDSELQYLRRELPEATKQTRRGIREIVDLIREIKTITQPFQVDTLQAIDINSTIKTIIEVAGEKWSKTVNIDLNLCNNVFQIICRENELKNAFFQYLDSRVEAVRENINMSRVHGKGTIHIKTKNHEKHIEIYIVDNGAETSSYTSKSTYNQNKKMYEGPQQIQPYLSSTEDVFCKKINGSIELHSENQTRTIMSICAPVMPKTDISLNRHQ